MNENDQKENGREILSAVKISKSFNSIEVLHSVNFYLKQGEVHGLVGQNGAGKSTLMKIISGVYSKDEGEILIRGKKVEYRTPGEAAQFGVAMVFQEFSLIPSMTVADNIFLAREPKRGLFVDESELYARVNLLLKELDVETDPKSDLFQLSVGKKQIIEIAKALSHNADILIMDEPTASLSNTEIQLLYKTIRKIKNDGKSIVFVTHHLNEIMEICDRVTVLRDGDVVLSDEVKKLSLNRIISAIVGKKFTKKTILRDQKEKNKTTLLELKGLFSEGKYENISFKLHSGEILGIAGVLGSGRSEILKTVYGILTYDAGEILVRGRKVKIKHPSDAIKQGIVYVPEDRRNHGVIYGQSVRMNMLLPIWKRITRIFLIQEDQGEEIVNRFIKKLDIRTPNNDQLIELLSGGNQQKVVLAKSLTSEPQILLLDDPTVGVDIGTKRDIYQMIKQIADNGNGVIFVSSEFEVMAEICDRILILQRGRIIDEFKKAQSMEINEEILLYAVQGNKVAR